jgi:O-antigen ligase
MMKVAPLYWEAFEDRIVAPLTTSALQSNGPWEFAGRLYEIQTAMKHISEHPILGLGVGMEYRDILPFEYLQAEVHENPDDAVHYMHNTYVYFWMKYGLLGVLAVIRILVYFLNRTWVLARGTGSQAVLFVGILAAFGALASSNLVSPSFLDSPAAPTLVGLMAGLVEFEHQGLVNARLRLQPSSSREGARPAMRPANPEIGVTA